MHLRGTFDDYLRLNRWGLQFLGVWHCEPEVSGPHPRLLLTLHRAFIFLSLFALLVPEFLDMYVYWGTFDANIETFSLAIFSLTVLFKLSVFLYRRNIFEDVVETMRKNWALTMDSEDPEREVHKTILLDMAAKARTYTKQYGFLMTSSAFSYFVAPVIGLQADTVREGYKYPFYAWYYFDRFSVVYYAIFYGLQIISGIVVGIGNCAMDTFFMVTLYHSCAQFRIIQHESKKLHWEKRGDFKINQLIQRHQKEIWHSQKLETIFTGTSFLQLIVSCMGICFIGFKVIAELNNGSLEYLVYIAFMLVSILQIFLYCKPGDELILQSTGVSDSIYQSVWTSLDSKAIQKIMIIINRAQRPVQITAGKLYILSIQNFMVILKTSMSFLSVIRAIYTKSDA